MDVFKVLTRLFAPHILFLDDVYYPREIQNMNICKYVYNPLSVSFTNVI